MGENETDALLIIALLALGPVLRCLDDLVEFGRMIEDKPGPDSILLRMGFERELGDRAEV